MRRTDRGHFLLWAALASCLFVRVSGECQDTNGYCGYWASVMSCHKYVAWMACNCPASCKATWCQDDLELKDSSCNCHPWALEGRCQQPDIQDKCPYTCHHRNEVRCSVEDLPLAQALPSSNTTVFSFLDLVTLQCRPGLDALSGVGEFSCGLHGKWETTHSDAFLCSAACVDTNVKCQFWARTLECYRNPGWMQCFCRQACNNPAQCQGSRDHTCKCAAWALEDKCGSDVIRSQCPYTCSLRQNQVCRVENLPAHMRLRDPNQVLHYLDRVHLECAEGYVLAEGNGMYCGPDGTTVTGETAPSCLPLPARCLDTNLQCAKWASELRCYDSAETTACNCPLSCRTPSLCQDTSEGDTDCRCVAWAQRNRCSEPDVLAACPVSCRNRLNWRCSASAMPRGLVPVDGEKKEYGYLDLVEVQCAPGFSRSDWGLSKLSCGSEGQWELPSTLLNCTENEVSSTTTTTRSSTTSPEETSSAPVEITTSPATTTTTTTTTAPPARNADGSSSQSDEGWRRRAEEWNLLYHRSSAVSVESLKLVSMVMAVMIGGVASCLM